MKKINIAYVVSTLEKGGPTNQNRNIINGLNKNKFNVIVITISPEPNNSQYEGYIEDGIEVISLNLTRFTGLFKIIPALRIIIKERNIDLIHSFAVRSDLANCLLSSLVKSVTTIRTEPKNTNPHKFGKLFTFLLSRIHLVSLFVIKNRVSCSHSIGQYMFDKFRMRSKVISNGVNSDFFVPQEVSKMNKWRLNYSIPIDSEVFIVLGDLISRKNVRTVINAFNEMSSDTHKFLLIVGDGPERDRLESLSRNPNILFMGRQLNPLPFLQASDYMISASLGEGLPNSILEALSCSLPVILSDINPHIEILSKNDNIGFAFEATDYKLLLSILKGIDLNEYDYKSKESRATILKWFSMNRMSESYQEYYINLFKK